MLGLYIIFGVWALYGVIYPIYKGKAEKVPNVLLIIPIFLLAEAVVSDPQPRTLVEFRRQEIISLERGSETSGMFFLGIGGFGSEARYYFYKKLKDGSYILDSVSAYKMPLLESDKETPALVESRDRYGKCKNALYCSMSDGEFGRYVKGVKLVVPKGTILRRFDVSKGDK